MTESRDQIRSAFTAELKLSDEYQEVLLLKQSILDEIAAPNIVAQLKYTFTMPMTDSQINIFKLCYLVEFGWVPDFVTNDSITIDMVRFL